MTVSTEHPLALLSLTARLSPRGVKHRRRQCVAVCAHSRKLQKVRRWGCSRGQTYRGTRAHFIHSLIYLFSHSHRSTRFLRSTSLASYRTTATDHRVPMVSSHGLATSVQSTTESTTYDLAGLSKDGISTALSAALSNPLVLPPGGDGMIRLTFVVGAGKNTRQRYDADAHKAVALTLDKLGYSEDRGASCVAECGGSYKLQHDTGKNLKTVVVFPFVEAASGGGAGGDRNGTDDGAAAAGCLIPENSPGYKIAACSLPTFRALLTNQCATWSEKRGCLESLTALLQLVQECDAKLMNGQMLDEEEQHFYDIVVDLGEKEAHAKEEATAMVEAGELTAHERDMLLEQNAERIAALQKEGKKVPDKIFERKALLEGIASQAPAPRLRHESKIAKLYKELGPLLRMEDAARGRLLSVKETQTLARKDEILEEIEYLEQSSQGWFEDDDLFHQRVESCRQKHAKAGGGKKAAAGVGKRVTATSASLNKIRAPVTNKWVTPGAGGGWNSKTGTKDKKKKGKGGAVFTAMMMDSDSDEEEDDEIVEEREEEEADGHNTNTTSGDIVAKKNEAPASSSKPSASASTSGSSKKKSKKKNKKKGGARSTGKNHSSADENRALEAAVAENSVATSKGEEEMENVEQNSIVQVWTFLTTYIFPLIMALIGLLTWIIGLLFGTAKKSKGRKKKAR